MDNPSIYAHFNAQHDAGVLQFYHTAEQQRTSLCQSVGREEQSWQQLKKATKGTHDGRLRAEG